MQRLEHVVSELEKKIDLISSATSVDKDTLEREIKQLRIQVKETTEAEAHDVVPKSRREPEGESQKGPGHHQRSTGQRQAASGWKTAAGKIVS